jgi:type VI secretion system secreted protein Hcp
MAAVDIFLKLDGISGESLDDKHKDEIELSSFSFGESNPAAHVNGGGAGAGRVSFQDIHFTSRLSKASPQLMLACATGKHIKEGQITVRKAGDNAQTGTEFLFYKFDTVIITSVLDNTSTDGGPVESVSFAFAKIHVEYKEQKADGTLGATVDFAWDLKANKKI